MTTIFKEFRETIAREWAKFRPILFAHHPSCKYFTKHTLNIKNLRFCIGCFIGYPSALVSLLLFHNLYFSKYEATPLFIIIGILCFLPIFLSLTNITKIKPIKIGQKFSVGIGSGMIIAYLLAVVAPSSILSGFFWFFGIISILLAPVGYLHYRTMTAACANCPDQWNPVICDLNYCMAPRNMKEDPQEPN